MRRKDLEFVWADTGLVYKLYIQKLYILSCILVIDTLVDEVLQRVYTYSTSSTSNVQACKLGFLELCTCEMWSACTIILHNVMHVLANILVLEYFNPRYECTCHEM